MIPRLHTRDEEEQSAAQMRIKELEEENEILFSQLHQVQEELEKDFLGRKETDSGHSITTLKIDWVDDELLDAVVENLRLRVILEEKEKTHHMETQNALNARLGDVLIEGVDSPGGLLKIPGKLGRIWRESNRQTPPGVLGGKSFDKVISAYREGGADAVDALLNSVLVPPGMLANALTAVARSLKQVEADKAAEFARRAYVIDPRSFRRKWLAFRLHEAGEVIEADAILETLPPDTKFSDSEARQASRLRNEAKQARLHEAKQRAGYAERRALVDQQLSKLVQERDDQVQLAAERDREIEVLRTAQSQLEQEASALVEQREEQARLAEERGREIEALRAVQSQLEQESSVLTGQREEQTRQAEERGREIEALRAVQSQLEQEASAQVEQREEQARQAEERDREIEALRVVQSQLEQEASAQVEQREEQARQAEERDREIEALRTVQSQLEQEASALTGQREEQTRLAEERGREIEALRAVQSQLEQESSVLTGQREEQTRLAEERGREIEALRAVQSQLEQESSVLTGQREEQTRLAAERGREIKALKAAQSQLKREKSVLARRYEEQGRLAAERQGELVQFARDQLLLEKEKSGLELRKRELEQQLEALACGVDEQAKLVAQQIQELFALTVQRNDTADKHYRKQSDDLIQVRKYLAGGFKSEIINSTKQIQSLLGLQSYYATGELPTLNSECNSWPVSPDFALYLVELIELNDYDLVVEFGSGISTLIVAKALAGRASHRHGKSTTDFASFDHLDAYHVQTRSRLEQAGLADAVQLMLAPLQDWQAPNGNTYLYYSCLSALVALAKKHATSDRRLLVIVDGPPADTGKHARYPAVPLLLQHFAGAHIDILLDDYIRDDEKEIVQLWQADIQTAGLEHRVTERKLEKEACLISVYPGSKKGKA